MLTDAELDAMQKSGWSVSASTQLQRLIAAYRELRVERDDNSDFMAFMQSELAKIPCCHEAGEHDGTPPMMWPELIRCIVRKAVDVETERLRQELSDLKARVANGAV